MFKKWFIILAVIAIPVAFSAGFVIGTKEGSETNLISTQKRLMRLEQQTSLLERGLAARTEADEVFVHSMAEAHRKLSSYEGATNDLRDELLAWERQSLRLQRR